MKQCGINTVRRQHFRARGDVGSREPQLFAAPVPFDDSTGDEMIATQHRLHVIYPAGAEQLADARAAHSVALHENRFDHRHFETETTAPTNQVVDAALSSLPEAKVFAGPDFFGFEPSHEQVAHELLRAALGKRQIEMLHGNDIDTEIL